MAFLLFLLFCFVAVEVVFVADFDADCLLSLLYFCLLLPLMSLLFCCCCCWCCYW